MSKSQASYYRQILGVRFFIGPPCEAIRHSLSGGLMVAPSGPGMAEIPHDKPYRDALLNSDVAITDSGFMVLLWRLFCFQRLPRLSGLEYFKLLVAQPCFKEPGGVFWIMPSETSRERNIQWLTSQSIPVNSGDCYVAPIYDYSNVSDSALLEIINRQRPSQIVIAIGGGIQEKLGHFLKTNLKYKPGIHCIGAAIAFLSGEQVEIPRLADRLFLGWLFRCVSQPTRFLPRYWKAGSLLPILFKFRENLPPHSLRTHELN